MLETVDVGTQDLYEHSVEAEAVTQLHGLAAPLGRASPPRRGTGRAVPRTVVARWESDRTYFNVTERSVDGDDLFPPDTYRRLREVKALYDPEELFQAMHSISPAR